MEVSNNDTGITQKFLQNIFKPKVESFSVRPGSNDGDNFTSVLHSIEVQLEDEDETKHLLLKVYPSHPMRKKFLDDTNLFLKELMVYKSLVPELHKILESGNTNEQKAKLKLSLPPLVAGKAIDYLGHNTSARKMSVIEELAEELDNYLLMVDARKTWGFQMACRRSGLDYDHCKLVVNEIAKFHAVNWNYFIKKDLKRLKDEFPFVIESIFRQDQAELLNGMMGANFQLVEQALENAPGLNPAILNGLKRFKEDPLRYMLFYLKENEYIDEDEAIKFLRVKPEALCSSIVNQPWKVGSHGDLWVNNMLFRYCPETKKPIETMFVDLQLYREACPTIDLAYFFYTSTTSEFRKKNLDTLLEFYSDRFLHYCKILEVKPLPGFTCSELKRRFHLSKIFGLMAGIMLLPIMLQRPEEAQNLDNMKIESERGDGDEEQNLSDMMKALTSNSDENRCLTDRFVRLAKEFYDDGIL